jgi:hypothetical protein
MTIRGMSKEDADTVNEVQRVLVGLPDATRHKFDPLLAMLNRLVRAQGTVDEIQILLLHWKSMPEHLHGGQCLQQLDTVMMGGFAPGPRPIKKDGPPKR